MEVGFTWGPSNSCWTTVQVPHANETFLSLLIWLKGWVWMLALGWLQLSTKKGCWTRIQGDIQTSSNIHGRMDSLTLWVASWHMEDVKSKLRVTPIKKGYPLTLRPSYIKNHCIKDHLFSRNFPIMPTPSIPISPAPTFQAHLSIAQQGVLKASWHAALTRDGRHDCLRFRPFKTVGIFPWDHGYETMTWGWGWKWFMTLSSFVFGGFWILVAFFDAW